LSQLLLSCVNFRLEGLVKLEMVRLRTYSIGFVRLVKEVKKPCFVEDCILNFGMEEEDDLLDHFLVLPCLLDHIKESFYPYSLNPFSTVFPQIHLRTQLLQPLINWIQKNLEDYKLDVMELQFIFSTLHSPN
jgi:hypothetical protein